MSLNFVFHVLICLVKEECLEFTKTAEGVVKHYIVPSYLVENLVTARFRLEEFVMCVC